MALEESIMTAKDKLPLTLRPTHYNLLFTDLDYDEWTYNGIAE